MQWVAPTKAADADSESSDDDDNEDSGLNPKESTPTAIPGKIFPAGIKFVQVAASDSASFALTEDGQVYGWGTFRVSDHLEFFVCHTDNCRVLMVSLVSLGRKHGQVTRSNVRLS